MDRILSLLGDGLREILAFRRNNPDLVAEELHDRARRIRQRAESWATRGRHRWARRALRRAERVESRALAWDEKARKRG